MAPTAAYDEIADWYEQEFPARQRPGAERLPIRDGLDGHWTRASWTDRGVRARVGATHRPLPELLHGFLDAGLTLERLAEGGTPTPAVLAVRARKRCRGVRAGGG